MLDAKTNMIKQQLQTWDVNDQSILHLFERIDRVHFVGKEQTDLAYADMALPLPHDEEMLAPKIQAKMLEALALQLHETVLEIGTGSGYLTALMAACVHHVTSIEFHKDISASAAQNLQNQGCLNVTLLVGNGASGVKLEKPVDVIVITGGLPFLPAGFQDCLSEKGRILAILGEGSDMRVTLITRSGKGHQATPLFETATKMLRRAPEAERFVF